MISRIVVCAGLALSVTEPGLADELLTLDSHGAPVSSSPLIAGHTYSIYVEGTYTHATAGQQADAEWKELDPGQGWVEYDPDPLREPVHDVIIDEVGYDWSGLDGGSYLPHQFSPTHQYMLTYVGAGVPIELRIYDTQYSDNSGSLTVTIVPEPATISVLALGGLTLLRRSRK